MYSSVHANLGTWEILRAEWIETVDATADVCATLADPQLLERCYERHFWRAMGVTLVELEPDGDILPARANYDPDSPEYGIGINPLRSHGRLWYALPDAVAAGPKLAANADFPGRRRGQRPELVTRASAARTGAVLACGACRRCTSAAVRVCWLGGAARIRMRTAWAPVQACAAG
jgi:hypothetical protein